MVVELLSTISIATAIVDLAAANRSLVSRFEGHVGLSTDNGVDPTFSAGLIEVQDSIHVAVVGNAKGRHSISNCLCHQRIDSSCPVEHRELGVGVQVGKTRRHCRSLWG